MLDATRKLLTGRASLAGSGRKEGPLGQLWAEGASGKRDFALSEPDVSELLATFVRHFPAGGSLEQISQGLEGTVDDARGMLRVLCAYFNRQISDDSDPDVVRLFTPNGERAAAQNCLIIARIVLPGLSTSEDLQPVCEAGVPSRAIKLLVRMQTMCVLIESGRSSNRSGIGPDTQLTHDEINTALNVVVRILRHVCGAVSSEHRLDGNAVEGNDLMEQVNTSVVEELVRGDAIRSLIYLAAQSAKTYHSGLSRWIEVHATDVLLTVLRHGMCQLLSDHIQSNHLLQPVVEALVESFDAEDTPNLLGVIGLFKVLLQSSVAASAIQLFDFVDHVRSLQIRPNSDKQTSLVLPTDDDSVPLLLSLLKNFLIKLARLVYVQGSFVDEEDEPDAYTVQWNSLSAANASAARRAHSKRAWGEISQEEVKEGLHQLGEFKARRVAYLVSGEAGVRLARAQAMRLLSQCDWDVEEAAQQCHSLMTQETLAEAKDDDDSTQQGGLGLRLLMPDDSDHANAPPKYFIVTRVSEHGSAYRSGAVHVGDRLLKVDGVPTSKMTLQELGARLRGPIGSQVTLVLQAQGAGDDKGTRSKVRLATLLRSALMDRPDPVSRASVLSDRGKLERVEMVMERLQGVATREAAVEALEASKWNVERAVHICSARPHSQAISHLLDIARELVFVGGGHADFNIAGNQFGDQSNTTGEDKDVHVESEERGGGSGLVGRRVRDVQAFDLLCELWTASHTCADDQLRLQLLDMAFAIFAEHPLNFFALQVVIHNESHLLSSAMDCLEFLDSNVKKSVLRMLEYVLTVEGCLPLQHLCRLTRNMDELWRKSTAAVVISNVIKWLQFDSKLVAVFRQTGLLHLLIRHCQIFSQIQEKRQQSFSKLLDQNSIPESHAEHDYFLKLVHRAGLVAPDGTISYHALTSHVQLLVDFGALSADLIDLDDEEVAVLLDRVWAAIDPEKMLKHVPIAWHVSADQVAELLRLIHAGHTAEMPSIPPQVIGNAALAIARAYVEELAKEQSFNALVAQPLSHANGFHDEGTREMAKDDTTCMVSAHTFPIVIDALLVFITGNPESVEVARNEGLAVSMMRLIPILEWRDGAFSLVERIILEDPFLETFDLNVLLELVRRSDPSDLELRMDLVQMMLKLSYSHPRVRSELRFGWMQQAVRMIADLAKAKQRTWGEKLRLAEMLATFLCLGIASSETNRNGFWSEVGPAGFANAFDASSLMLVGRGLTVIGMMLAIGVSRDVVPETMLHGGENKSEASKEKSQRHWQGIGLDFDSSTETAVFLNRWGDHSEAGSSVANKVPRLRNPDAVMMALTLLELVHQDSRLQASRVILRLARFSLPNTRALAESGFLSILLEHYRESLWVASPTVSAGSRSWSKVKNAVRAGTLLKHAAASEEDHSSDERASFASSSTDATLLQPVLRELLVHFARHRLSVRDLHNLFQRLIPPGISTPQMVQALDVFLQAAIGQNLNRSMNTLSPVFEAVVNGSRQGKAHKIQCEGIIDVRGVTGLSWPPNNAFTFCTWLRIDSLGNEVSRKSYKTESKLGSASSDTGDSLTKTTATKPTALIFLLRAQGQDEMLCRAVLADGVLIVESTGHFKVTFAKYSFEFGRVYQLGIIYQRHILGSDSLILYVDGVIVEEQKVSYEKSSSTGHLRGLKRRFDLLIGGDFPGEGAAQRAWIPPCVFRLGDCCVVDEALPHKYVHGLYLVGSESLPHIGSELSPLIAPDVWSNEVLASFQTERSSESTSTALASIHDSALAKTGQVSPSAVRFSCSAASFSSYRQVLPFSAAQDSDNSIAQLVSKAFDAESGGTVAIHLNENVHCVHSLPFADSLRGIGGVQMLLEMVSIADTPDTLSKTLWLLVSCVRLNTANLHKMAACGGYSFLGLVLQRKARLLSISAIHAIFDMVGISSINPTVGALSNELALRDLLLSHKLWQTVGDSTRDDVYRVQVQAITCKYDEFTAARLEQVGAVASWLDLITQETCPLSETSVHHVLSILSFVLQFHLKAADVKRVMLTILGSLPPASGSQEWEWPSRRVHVRNLLLSTLIALVKRVRKSGDESVWSELSRVVNSKYLLHILSRRVHSSTMSLVLQLLTLHLLAKSKYSKKFAEAGGMEELAEIMPSYYACPHAYLLMLHLFLSSPIAAMPEVLDSESFGLFLKTLEPNEAALTGAMAAVGTMLQHASSICEHLAEPRTAWTTLCSVRTSLDSQPPHDVVFVPDAEMLGFVSDLLKGMKMLFEKNSCFRKHCLNDALLATHMLSVVLRPDRNSDALATHGAGSHEHRDAMQTQAFSEDLLTDASTDSEETDMREDPCEAYIIAGGHEAAVTGENYSASRPHAARTLSSVEEERGVDDSVHMAVPSQMGASMEELSPEDYALLQQHLSLSKSQSIQELSPEELQALEERLALSAEWALEQEPLTLPAAQEAATQPDAQSDESKVVIGGVTVLSASNRRVSLGGVVSGASNMALLPLKGAVAGVEALGSGAVSAGSALGDGLRSVKFDINFGTSSNAKEFEVASFSLVDVEDYVQGTRDGPPLCAELPEATARESSFVEVDLGAGSPAAKIREGGDGQSASAGPCRPRSPPEVLRQLSWCIPLQTMELLGQAVLQSLKTQARGYALLCTTLDGAVPSKVDDEQVAAYQTRMLLSLLRVLTSETDSELVLGNTKLAINMIKLGAYSVDKMYTGWLLVGHSEVIRYLVHCVAIVKDHSPYWNLYRGVASSTWRAAAYVVSVGVGDGLSAALYFLSESFAGIFNEVGMDAALCSYLFKALTDVLISGSSAEECEGSLLLQRAAKLAGQLLSLKSPHTRKCIMDLLVYKPSMTSLLFRKGERDKALDLYKNGFEHLCGSESVSTLNPLRAWRKPGDHVLEFRRWALEPETRAQIVERLWQASATVSKEFDERCAKICREDVCPLRVRWSKEQKAAKRTLRTQKRRQMARDKRSLVLGRELEAHLRERRVDACRRLMRERAARLCWRSSQRLLYGPAGVWTRESRLLDEAPTGWALDEFQDALHTRRRLVPMELSRAQAPQAVLPQAGSHQWLSSATSEEVSDLAHAVSLPGVTINKDWNHATSDEEEEEVDVADALQEKTLEQLRARRDLLLTRKSELEGTLAPNQQGHHNSVDGSDVSHAAAHDEASPAKTQAAPAHEHANSSKISIFNLARFRGRGRKETSNNPPCEAESVQAAGETSQAHVAGGLDLHQESQASLSRDSTPEPTNEAEYETEEEQDTDMGQAAALGGKVGPSSRASSASDVDVAAVDEVGSTGAELNGLDDYRIAAFIDESEDVSRTYKASRVEGLDSITGTLVLCRKKGGDSRVKTLYLIDDCAFEAIFSLSHDDEPSMARTCGGNQVCFGHINLVAPGVFKWEEDKCVAVKRRSWLQQPLALELCDSRGAATLLVLSDVRTRNDIVADLSSYGGLGSASAAFGRLSGVAATGWRIETKKMLSDARKVLVKKWCSGLVSNFEFLMEMNLLAGRSTNDLSRYPVFPWVLADYSSETLDLNDPASFRDLSKPMGCQNALRQQAFEERYDEWDQDENECPAFHYGTHYSTSAHVLFYLVRVQPFTSMHLSLQSGHFDQPDRLFHDLSDTWRSTSGNENMTEVKELVPEMFFLPEVFTNGSRLALGKRQDGHVVDDVVLPPWAHGDATEFVRLHRAALESVYVSAHLHKWIDLVFGYRQRGKFAVEAVNVFHYMTYEGAIDVTSISDETQYQAVLSQISHFGQCPKQLFQRPHPARVTTPGYSAICNPELLHPISVNVGMTVGDVLTQQDKVLAIGYGSVLVQPAGELCLIPDIRHPGSVSVVVTETKKTAGLLQRLHQGLVTALAVTCDTSVLGTGGQDGLVRFWDLTHEAWWTLPARPLSKYSDALLGHRGAVGALALSKSQGVAVSGATDASAIMWDLARSTSMHVLDGHEEAVVAVAIDDENGSVLTCSASRMQAWSISGERLANMHRHDSKAFKVEVRSCAARQGSIWTSETIFVTGHSDGRIVFWKLVPTNRARREGIIPRDVVQSDSVCPRVLAPMWTLSAGGEAATVVRFNGACRELVSGHEQGRCNIWRISESRPLMQDVHALMQQDFYLLAFAEGLAEASGRKPTSRTTCLARQAALDVVRSAANPCEAQSQDTLTSKPGSSRGRGVYVALAAHGYLDRAVLALGRVDPSGDLVDQWHEWLQRFTGDWSQFWDAAEAFLFSNIPLLTPTWIHDQVDRIARSARS